MTISINPGSKLHVLVIDDDNDIRESLVDILNEMDIFTSIVQATNGIDGVQKMLNQKFDVIITDLAMPKMTGLEFITKINKDNYKFIPSIILLSGSLTTPEVQEAIKLGVKNVIVKPCSEEDFISKVTKVLGETALGKVRPLTA